MEQTVDAYLQRLPTEKLEKFLQDYLNGEFTEDFSDAIGKVVQELARRNAEKNKA